MGKTYVLDRVAADLARGLTHPAIQRLSSLVHAYPTDLDLRRRLAALYRRIGNRVQAGRWDYLTIGADAADTSAFERAFPSAAARLRAVRWPYQANAAATSYARSRLAKLAAAVESEAAEVRPEVPAQPAAGSDTPAVRRLVRTRLAPIRSWRRLRRAWRSPSTSLLAVAAVVAASLVVVGTATVVGWFVQ